MMSKYYFAIILTYFALPILQAQTPCEAGMAGDYPCQNIDLFAHLTADQLGAVSKDGVYINDIWGWTDATTGKEYVLLGMANGTSFIDTSDPIHPVILGMLPERHASGRQQGAGANSLWRDIKVYKNFAYIVSEDESYGMQIFDLTQLRDVTNPPVTFAQTATYDEFGAAHNIAINEATGYAYIASPRSDSQCDGGIQIINLADPANPVFEACLEGGGATHDSQCVIYQGDDPNYQGKEICFNFNESKLVIANVEDKSNISTLASVTYDGVEYVHQGWLTEDHNYLLSNDELDELNKGNKTTTFIWDVRDLSNPKLIGTYVQYTDAIDHNLYTVGTRTYMSNYNSGLRMTNIADIANANLSEIGYFDTFPDNDDADWFGTWSNYPFFSSGIIAVSDITGGLFLVKPNITTTYIVDQPANVVLCSDENTNMSVVVGGLNPMYAWQVDDGNGFVDLVESAEYTNVDQTVLSIVGAQVAQSGDVFRCKITPERGEVMYSDQASLEVNSAPLANFSSEVVGNTVDFTNNSLYGETYAWDFGDRSMIDDSFSPSHVYSNVSKEYTVVLTVTNGCASVMVENAVTIAAVTDVKDLSEPKLLLYPNPTIDKVSVKELGPSVAQYVLMTISGQEIKSGMLTPKRDFIDLSQLDKGTYLIRIHQEGAVSHLQRIVLK